MDRITTEDIDVLPLPGGPYNVNCALKTLRRIFMRQKNGDWLRRKLSKELGRTLRLDQEAERKLLAAANSLLARGLWTRKMQAAFCDVVVLVRDTGMRNKKELFCARIEDIDWNNRLFFIRDSKTDNGRRFVPLSDRVWERLKARCGDRREGWIFPAFSASGHLTTVDKKFRQASLEAELAEKLVLYCGRHDYGTRGAAGHRQSLSRFDASWAGQTATTIGVNPKNETVKEDTLCRKGNCEWQRDGILNIFDMWQWSEWEAARTS
jgi:integrase